MPMRGQRGNIEWTGSGVWRDFLVCGGLESPPHAWQGRRPPTHERPRCLLTRSVPVLSPWAPRVTKMLQTAGV